MNRRLCLFNIGNGLVILEKRSKRSYLVITNGVELAKQFVC